MDVTKTLLENFGHTSLRAGQHAPDFEKMDELQRNIREGMTPAKWAS